MFNLFLLLRNGFLIAENQGLLREALGILAARQNSSVQASQVPYQELLR